MRFTPYPDGILPGKLVPIDVPSIYRNYSINLPDRLAWLTPDAAGALEVLRAAVNSEGGEVYLSDAFRSVQDQAKAHFDYLTGHSRWAEREIFVLSYPFLRDYVACNSGRGKRAFSPKPGFSFHEAGRAIDIDMDPARLGMDQREFADVAHELGWRDVVGGNFGDPNRVDVKEEWHWEFWGPSERDLYYGLLESTKSKKNAYQLTAQRAVMSIKLKLRNP